jgi:hypothetical protein
MKKFGSGLVNVDLDDLVVVVCLAILGTVVVGAAYLMIRGIT